MSIKQSFYLIPQVIPDPNHLVSGWLSEDDGICFWPLILYGDISTF